MKRSFFAGLSLIETLIIIALLGLLSWIMFWKISLQLQKGRDLRRKVDLQKIAVALYEYTFDNGCFPKQLPNCGEKLILGNNTYLKSIPCDPQNATSYRYEVDKGCSKWFRLFANLEVKNDPIIVENKCESGCGPEDECTYNYGIASTNKELTDGCLKLFACSSSGACLQFINPEDSRCPLVFENDPTCQNLCEDRKNRCHDERGKQN